MASSADTPTHYSIGGTVFPICSSPLVSSFLFLSSTSLFGDVRVLHNSSLLSPLFHPLPLSFSPTSSLPNPSISSGQEFLESRQRCVTRGRHGPLRGPRDKYPLKTRGETNRAISSRSQYTLNICITIERYNNIFDRVHERVGAV